jgi:hypothetical protein
MASQASPGPGTSPIGTPGPSTPGPSAAPLTLDALLAQFANAPSPTHAALEAALSERNQLAAHNAQLWRMIEKVKASANHLGQDASRLRTERDAYKRALQDVGENPEAILRRAKAAKAGSLGSGRDSPAANGRVTDLRKTSDDGLSSLIYTYYTTH